eukprot:COSAG01_NODE_8344_length_2822_cov_3.161219_4_plen_75_part_00
MGLDYLAHHRALATAYRLLEDFGVLRLGDCVIQNAPETAVSQLIPSLCSEFVRMTGTGMRMTCAVCSRRRWVFA